MNTVAAAKSPTKVKYVRCVLTMEIEEELLDNRAGYRWAEHIEDLREEIESSTPKGMKVRLVVTEEER